MFRPLSKIVLNEKYMRVFVKIINFIIKTYLRLEDGIIDFIMGLPAFLLILFMWGALCCTDDRESGQINDNNNVSCINIQNSNVNGDDGEPRKPAKVIHDTVFINKSPVIDKRK